MEQMAQPAKTTAPPAAAAAPANTKPEPRDDGATTAAERHAEVVSSKEHAEVGRLIGEVGRLERQVSQSAGLLDQKDRRITELEEQVGRLQREVGRLAVGHVQAGAVPKGLSVEEFKEARRKGITNFVVLDSFAAIANLGPYSRGQGLDARQHPAIADLIPQGLLVAPVPQGG